MAFRSNSTVASMPFPITTDEQVSMMKMNMNMNSSSSSSSPGFPSGGKGPDPLSPNWTYDSAIDLFSLNSMVDPFRLSMPEELMNFNPGDVSVDAFTAPPAGIDGFAILNHHSEDAASRGSTSSDPDSDDQLWSPTIRAMSSADSGLIDIKPETYDYQEPYQYQYHEREQEQDQEQLPQTQEQQAQTHRRPHTRKRQLLTPRWSSSPEMAPQEFSNSYNPTSSSTPAETRSNRRRTRTRSSSSESNSNSNSNKSIPTARNAAKRAAHNIIEKRYRTNMNAKFVALEEAMLCFSRNTTTTTTTTTDTNMTKNKKSSHRGGSSHQKQNKTGGSSSGALKKSEILSNAIAYMEELQEENRQLRKDMALLHGSHTRSGVGSRHGEEAMLL